MNDSLLGTVLVAILGGALRVSTPFMFVALGECLTEKSGRVNLGLEGTLVLVSHDRHLLRATTDQFLIVADGSVQPFDGDLDDYRDWLFKTKLAEAA